MTACSRGPNAGHIEEPGTGRCFACRARIGPPRPVARRRSEVDADDWSDPAGVDRDPDDDPADAEYVIRHHRASTQAPEFSLLRREGATA